MTPALAQINIARARFDHDAPEMAEFFNRIDAINAVAEQSEGFLWQLAGEPRGDAAIDVFGDARLVVNISMWSSLEALESFVHQTAHAWMLARRAEWLEEIEAPHVALWWRAEAEPPSMAEGAEKLRVLKEQGPSSAAFTFATAFDAEGAPKSSHLPHHFAGAA